MNQFIRFILVGVVNSGLGYGVIFACMYLAGVSPELSNVIGYMVGLVFSYLLHRNFTFRSTKMRRTEFIRFSVVFLIAYCANLVTLIVLVRAVGVYAGLSQVIAGLIYIGTSYLLNKYYVFQSIEISR
jgi:putative flippase GtrA